MVSLITYADRLAGNLAGLRSLLEGELRGLFGGVHILPFFTPIDGADAGFDPVDHLSVDQQIGSWAEVTAIGATHAVMADLIVNHVSVDSKQFRDVMTHGERSEFWPMFLRKESVFPENSSACSQSEDLARVYRPRPGSPFTAKVLDTGRSYEFWTTFSSSQLDIDVESEEGRHYLESILARFADARISELRLDAAGYAIKRRGTSCFMLPETFDFIASLSARAQSLGINTLVEIHSHYLVQCEIAARVGRVYDFALPPLVLHTLYNNDASVLKHWLTIAPRNCVTVLDTHDGIGIVDVGRSGELEGLLSDAQIDRLVETIHEKTGGKSKLASGHAASNLDIYQVNSTYYDAVGGSDMDYLIARAIQFFAPGTPQVYYVGLLVGKNDLDLVERTGVGRDINRHYYSAEELSESLRRPVVQELLAMIRLRNRLSVFAGDFSILESFEHELILQWADGDDYARLSVNLLDRVATIRYMNAGVSSQYEVGASLREKTVESV
ncbi:MAG: sucrose phosphorylase [Congregibacter sp.]